MLGIVGGTGSGKSTIARLIRHAYTSDTGKVMIFGKDINDYGKDDITSLISNVPQKPWLFSGSIRENISVKKDIEDEKIIRALKAACAYDFVEKKGGLDARVKARGANFSGGQRQRLTIARAIARESAIFIFDDSTSALDAVTEREVIANIRNLGATAIIISQRCSSVKSCDDILVMDGGWCIGSGTHEELLRTNDVYREIYEVGIS